MEWSDPAVAVTGTPEEPSAAASAAEGAIEEDLPASEIAAPDDAPRPVPSQSLEALTDVTELKITEARSAPKASEKSGRHQRPQAAPAMPVQAELAAALPVRVQETAAPKAAPEQTEQQPSGPSMLPENKEGPRVPRRENAAEQRRIGVTPAATKTEPPPAAGAPVIEFEVRREPPAQDVRQQSESADWLRAIQSRAETRQEPAPQKDLKQAGFRPPEPSDGLRPVARRVAVGPQADLGARQQAERGGSGDAAEASDEAIERMAQPSPRALNVKSILAKLSFNPQADNERSEQVPLKPLGAATPPAQPAHGPQTAAAANSVPLAAYRDQPPEATRPVAAAIPPGEPVIAAKLHQQSGRTTLNVVLQDERLGRVALQIVERGGWIETAIRASDPRTAQSLSHGAAGLFEALQQRGLTLAAGTGASPWDAREGQRRDNPQRDQESQRRRFRLRRSGGEFEGALARAEV
jgi:hypothetical protein